MRRAAIYARFSSELQSARSIDDQVDLCRAHCAREGLIVGDVFADRALSGATTAGRHGLDSLLKAAAEGRTDIVVVEALDRLSRDMADLATIYKLLRFAGVTLIAVHDGAADEIAIGVRGLVGALYLTDLAHKTRRGLAGKVKQGMRAGGLPYGYRPIAGRPGEHEIFEPEAAVVRQIFDMYAGGATPRQIACRLNEERVAPVRGRAWNASTINGSTKRASGMLANEVYVGRIVWNRVGKIKNPTTGKKVPRINKREEWHRTEAPQLRIVDETTWTAVEARLEERRCGPRASVVTNKTRLLSGLLKCAVCGCSIVSAGSDHGRPVAQCTRVRESGDCTNRRRIYLDTIETAVVDGLRERLQDEAVLGEAVREYHAERQRLAAASARGRIEAERRLDELRRQIERLVDAIANGTATAAVGRRLRELETQEAELAAEIEVLRAETDVVTMHPKAIEAYLAEIGHLSAAVRNHEHAEALAIVRRLVDHIVVYPREKGDPVMFDIAGRLAALIDPSVGPLVPRGGIEPPTLRFSVACSTN